MSPENAWHAYPSLRRTVPWTGSLLIAAIVGFAALDVARGYDETVAQTGRMLDAQATTIAEQTARSLQAVDVVLRHVAERHREGAFDTATPQGLHDELRDHALGLVQVDSLVLVDASGNTIASSARFPMPQPLPNIAEYGVFQRVRGERSPVTQFGPVRRSVVDGRWFLPIARRLEKPSGEFAGSVGARGRIEYFQQFYADVSREVGTRTALIGRDGTLVARFPAADGALGRPIEGIDGLIAAYQANGRIALRTRSPIDGSDRFGVMRAVPDYPFLVVVSRDADATLAAWRGHATGSALRTLLLAALAAALLWFLLRQLARVEATRASLAEARERFALAVAGSNDGIWDWDRATDRLYTSARAREIMGLQQAEERVPATDWFARLRVHPADDDRRWKGLQDHVAGRTPAFDEEFRVQQPDGGWRWVRVRGLCVRDTAGWPQRMAGSVSDVDARRRAEEARRESEERYALAVAASEDGVFDWDIPNDRMFTSERALRIIGAATDVTLRSRAEWLAMLRLHPDDVERHRRDLEDHFTGRTLVREGEYRLGHPDGSWRWVRVRGMSVRDANGVPIRWAGSISDIDAQKRTEQALRESDERYQLAAAGSNEGLWDWDLKRDLLYLSERGQRLFGFEAGEPLRPRREWLPPERMHPDDVRATRAALSAHLRGRTPHVACEFRLRHASGEWRWYRQRGVAVRDANGRPTRMAGSIEDITDRRHAEAERDRLEGQLRQAQKLEAIGTLAGGIAHDFNNILAAILGYGEMAQQEAGSGTRLRRHVDAALAAAARAKSLVERILAFSRSGVGERVPVHVESVVAEAIDATAAALPPGVILERRLEAGDAAVIGDATQIHQVVMNLCANALQSMRDGGRVCVRTALVESGEPFTVTTHALPAGRYLRLDVDDDGVGIAPRVLERIFDPFFTTREVGVGTGLGLSLVHGIVADLGGGIDVHSIVDHGTTMTVYLPCAGVTAPSSADDTTAPCGDGETVLVVDDEEALVRLGEEMLAGLGYEPVGFTSGLAALASVRATPERFQVVLTDEAMPELTGTDLVRELRSVRPDLPVVVVSGYVTPALAAKAREAGALDVLGKPLARAELARVLARALQVRSTPLV